jgi:acyl-CoA synthetase (NDP forming)
VTDPGELDPAVARIGLPLVMKVVSPRILHKSDAGGVLLGLTSPAEVRQAFEELTARFSGSEMRGAMLYRELSGGVEIIAGLKQDPDFGPVVLTGSGGVLAELLDDVAMRLAPFDREEAMTMLAELKISRLLEGFRGQPRRDLQAAADLLAALSRLGMRYPRIQELDLNPVFVLERGAVIADVRILAAG